jgi:3-deoxy-D-manno-octulosonic-acid transferase
MTDTQVLLGDSMGEMFFYCALADITLMGGSFKPFGCQNVIEPASVGVPVIVGPSTFNFAQVVEEGKRIGGIFQVENEHEALVKAHALLDDHQAWQVAHDKALAFSQAFIGATERTMKVIRTLWKN